MPNQFLLRKLGNIFLDVKKYLKTFNWTKTTNSTEVSSPVLQQIKKIVELYG